VIKQESVLILDFKGNINSHQIDARKRHLDYGKRLAKEPRNQSLNLTVISRSDHTLIEKMDCINFFEIRCTKFNVVRFLVQTKKILKNNNVDAKVIVSGDPWESFVLAKLLQVLLNNKSKIQIQIHADISDREWNRLDLKEWLRSKIQSVAIKKSDQVRVVSQRLKQFVLSIDNSQDIVVAPIPITLQIPNILPNEKDDTLIRIGFFGRLHKDRGTDLLIKLVKNLNKERQDFQILIAGKGPEEEFIKKCLESFFGNEKFTFLGHLSQDVLSGYLSSLDLYFSLAPSESYGLGLREAVLFGVPVIAVRSHGVDQAKEEYGENCIFTLEEDMSAPDLSNLIDRALLEKSKKNRTFNTVQGNDVNIDNLIKSWLKLSID
jgi:glycosyltransferase involved in cell wall biosynthesis